MIVKDSKFVFYVVFDKASGDILALEDTRQEAQRMRRILVAATPYTSEQLVVRRAKGALFNS